MYWHVWNYLYYPSPQSIYDNTDGPYSDYTQTQYLDRPAQEWGGVGVSQMNVIQGQTNVTNNYGSDYFMDAFGYMVGYAPTVAASEPVTYGAGQWVTVNGVKQYVAQPLPNTDWPTREPV